jgi:hypothetical protein
MCAQPDPEALSKRKAFMKLHCFKTALKIQYLLIDVTEEKSSGIEILMKLLQSLTSSCFTVKIGLKNSCFLKYLLFLTVYSKMILVSQASPCFNAAPGKNFMRLRKLQQLLFYSTVYSKPILL